MALFFSSFCLTLLLLTTHGAAMEPGYPSPRYFTMGSAKVFLVAYVAQSGKVTGAKFMHLTGEAQKKCFHKSHDSCVTLIEKSPGAGIGAGFNFKTDPQESSETPMLEQKTPAFHDQITISMAGQNFFLTLWEPFQFGWNNTTLTENMNVSIRPYVGVDPIRERLQKMYDAVATAEQKQWNQDTRVFPISGAHLWDIDFVMTWWEGRPRNAEERYPFRIDAQVIRLHEIAPTTSTAKPAKK